MQTYVPIINVVCVRGFLVCSEENTQTDVTTPRFTCLPCLSYLGSTYTSRDSKVIVIANDMDMREMVGEIGANRWDIQAPPRPSHVCACVAWGSAYCTYVRRGGGHPDGMDDDLQRCDRYLVTNTPRDAATREGAS